MARVRVAVTGAAGQIGYALLFRIASGEMFGRDVEIELSLIELPQAMAALSGVMMELDDCAFPLLKKVGSSADLHQGFSDADWAILVGSVPRKAGMERGDLLTINGRIFVDQGRALDAVAKAHCRVLVVGNPCNTNAFIAKESCRRLAPEQFFAMTMLDQNRAVAQLAAKAGARVSDVSRLAIWGNHSATQYPDFYTAKINGQTALDVIADEQWLQTAFIQKVQQRGAEIIQARGQSSAASAANAVVATVKHVIQPTPKNEFFSLAVSSDGSYGIEKGLIFSFPVRSDGQTCHIVPDIPLNTFSRKKISESAQELMRERDAVKGIFIA